MKDSLEEMVNKGCNAVDAITAASYQLIKSIAGSIDLMGGEINVNGEYIKRGYIEYPVEKITGAGEDVSGLFYVSYSDGREEYNTADITDWIQLQQMIRRKVYGY